MPQTTRSHEQYVAPAGLPLTEATPPRTIILLHELLPKPSKTASHTRFHTAVPPQSNADGGFEDAHGRGAEWGKKCQWECRIEKRVLLLELRRG